MDGEQDDGSWRTSLYFAVGPTCPGWAVRAPAQFARTRSLDAWRPRRRRLFRRTERLPASRSGATGAPRADPPAAPPARRTAPSARPTLATMRSAAVGEGREGYEVLLNGTGHLALFASSYRSKSRRSRPALGVTPTSTRIKRGSHLDETRSTVATCESATTRGQ